ncbi:MAG: ankyrin repeat domain-containing protein [Alphaproteobacteria bacterium]
MTFPADSFNEAIFWDLVRGADSEALGSFLDKHPDKFVNLQKKVDLGQTALVKCAYNNKVAHIEVLLAHGADVNLGDGHARTPLRIAAEYGHEGLVQLLVTRYGAAIDRQDCYGGNPLAEAAAKGHVGITRFLIEQGADVNARSTMGGWTPLMWALTHGQVETATIIAQNGANPRLRNYFGQTALSLAQENKYGDKEKTEELVRLLSLPLALHNINNGTDATMSVKPIKLKNKV